MVTKHNVSMWLLCRKIDQALSALLIISRETSYLDFYETS